MYEPQTFEAARLRKLHGYAAAISQVDAAVGRLIDWLDDAGIADNTIVIYSATMVSIPPNKVLWRKHQYVE